jgi:hypothetical protein
VDFFRKPDLVKASITVVGGEDEDEVELNLSTGDLLPKAITMPKIKTRTQVSLQLQVPQLPAGDEYIAGIIRLSLKHLGKDNRFPSASSLLDENWEECSDTTASEAFSISPPPYACYVKMKVANSFGQSQWSEILFVAPQSGRKGSMAALSQDEDLSTLDSEDPTSSVAKPSVKPSDLMVDIENADMRSKFYCLSCDLLRRHVAKLVDYFCKMDSSAAEECKEVVTVALAVVKELLEACSAPGWLALVIRPPQPSWVGKFQKAHLGVCMAGLKCGAER